MPIFHDASHPDPPQVRNWRVHLLSISVSMGAAAMGYDTGVIGGTLALPSFRRDFGLDRTSQHERDTLSGNIVSTFQVGTFFGSLLTFPLVEKYGRVKGMLAAGAVFMVGAVLMTAANGHLGMIYAGRGIAGLGSASLIIPVYIAEVSPPSIRGRLVGIFEILSQGGSMVGFWINYIMDRTVSSDTKTQWVIPLAIQMLPGLFLLLGAALAPESPRWLAKKDNWDKARKNLQYLRQLPLDSNYVEEELQGIREQIENERLLVGEAGSSWWSSFKELFHKGTRNRVAIGLTLMMCQNMTGVNFGGLIGSLPMWYIGGYVFVVDPATKAAAGQFTRNGSHATQPQSRNHLGTYFFFASLMIVFGIWAYFFVPETKGKTLEDMDRIFGVSESARMMKTLNQKSSRKNLVTSWAIFYIIAPAKTQHNSASWSALTVSKA
ncbi:quinate permease [Rhizoctonia solani AG-1 IA]|uniref:Quinate permease n=1 Tax=Thanatephorus cucumeris (strain AG1-IA) TaxID=983506 RepID=L8X017_THACA|nr:quinate permease [Rhizoctonia solani AG-1 IA]